MEGIHLKIAENVHQLRIPIRNNPLGFTFSYLISDSSTLIDLGVGTDEARASLTDQLKRVGFQVSDIENVVFTHLHNDHVGLSAYVESSSDATFYAGEKAEEVLASRGTLATGSNLASQLRSMGMPRAWEIPATLLRPISPRSIPSAVPARMTLLKDGQTLTLQDRSLKVIWTPGHAREHICLHDEADRVVYTGDHVLPEITPHISLRTLDAADPLADYVDSLKKMKGLDASLALPAHERIVENLDERIEELIQHHRDRCEEIKHTLLDKEKSAYEISSRVAWRSRPWPEMQMWTKQMAVAETVAHLKYMLDRGDVEVSSKDGVWYFGLPSR